MRCEETIILIIIALAIKFLKDYFTNKFQSKKGCASGCDKCAASLIDKKKQFP
jgi:hypothetical protein